MGTFGRQVLQLVVGTMALAIACVNVADLIISIGESRWLSVTIDALGIVFFGGAAILNLTEVWYGTH